MNNKNGCAESCPIAGKTDKEFTRVRSPNLPEKHTEPSNEAKRIMLKHQAGEWRPDESQVERLGKILSRSWLGPSGRA